MPCCLVLWLKAALPLVGLRRLISRGSAGAADADDLHSPPPVATPLLPALAGIAAHTAATAFRPPAALALALAVFALALPTGASVVLLVLAYTDILRQPFTAVVQHQVRAHARMMALSAWFVLDYILTATGLAAQLPAVLRALLLVNSPARQALGPLLHPLVTTLFFAAITAAAAHARAQRAETLWRLVTRRAFRMPTVAATATVPVPLPLLFGAHALGTILIPVGWFSLSMLHKCLCGTGYVCGPLLQWLLIVLQRGEAPKGAFPPAHWHLLMRTYAALHATLALALFLAQPAVPQSVIQAVSGSSAISLRRDVAPLLAMFVLASVHAVLGQHLRSRTNGGIPPPHASAGVHGGDSVTVPLLQPDEGASNVDDSEAMLSLARRWRAAIRLLARAALLWGMLLHSDTSNAGLTVIGT